MTSNQTNSFFYSLEIEMALKNLTNFSDELRQRYIEFYGNPPEHEIMCGVSCLYLGNFYLRKKKLNFTPKGW